jgi:hypothetical protein
LIIFLFLINYFFFYSVGIPPTSPATSTGTGATIGQFCYKISGTNIGGGGGDPHSFSFDGKIIDDLIFGDGKNYIFYGSDNFEVIIHTSGPQERSFITAIGITLHDN